MGVVNQILEAETNRDWATVRAHYPYLQSQGDDALTSQYSELANQQAYFHDLTPLDAQRGRVRFTLVAHNQDASGNQVTRAWCETWIVDVAADQANTSSGANPELTPPGIGLPGWLDPPAAPTCT